MVAENALNSPLGDETVKEKESARERERKLEKERESIPIHTPAL